MLAGGTTPLAAYGKLAARGLRAHRETTLLLSDERFVPRDDPASNVRALMPLITSLGVQRERQLLPDTSIAPAGAAAEDYAERVAAYLDCGGTLELGVLGMGADGHTASLFHTDDLARAANHLAIDVRRPDGHDGISLTPFVFAHFRELMVVVSGVGKREALDALLRGNRSSLIGRALARCAHVVVWCDAAAAPS